MQLSIETSFIVAKVLFNKKTMNLMIKRGTKLLKLKRTGLNIKVFLANVESMC